jgi:hypothetical protein
MPVIIATWEAEIGGSWFEASPRQIVLKTYLGKNLPPKRAGRVAQVIEHLPNKNEVLNANLSTTKKKTKNHIGSTAQVHCLASAKP